MGWRVRLVRRSLAGLALVVSIGLTGCVERRYTIRTNPPGALVVVNNEEIGTTPVSKTFYFYGDRDITLMLDGHNTQRIIQPIRAPWYDNYLTEFFTETIIPFSIRDERDFNYQMETTTTPVAQDLLQRGESLRQASQVVPPPRRGGILGFFGF